MLSPYPPTVQTPPSMAAVANGFAIAERAGYLVVTGSGHWTPAEVDRHFDVLIDRIRQTRLTGAAVRVVVDLRKSADQSAETSARLGARIRMTYSPADRVAIILNSSLAKMQMRRVVRTAQHAYFLSPDAAVTWLMAYETPGHHVTT